MADSPLTQIRGKKFRQREIDLDHFTDEELCSRYRFGRESIKYMVEILKNDFERQTTRKLALAVANVVTTSCNKVETNYLWNRVCMGDAFSVPFILSCLQFILHLISGCVCQSSPCVYSSNVLPETLGDGGLFIV